MDRGVGDERRQLRPSAQELEAGEGSGRMANLLILEGDDSCGTFATAHWTMDVRRKSDPSIRAASTILAWDGRQDCATRTRAQERVQGLESAQHVEVLPRQDDVSGTGGGQFPGRPPCGGVD